MHRALCDLLTQRSSYANLGVIDTDGNIFCTAVAGHAYLGDRVFFQRAFETRDFAIGEYQIGRLTDKASVNFGYPVLDDAGRVQAVVFAALDLAWLNKLASQAGLPEGTMLTVTDRNGRILSRYPDDGKWVASSCRSRSLERLQTQKGHGTADAPGTDGTRGSFRSLRSAALQARTRT